jgi:hypothetical protein
MKYTVVWVPTAEQELAALWMDAANRAAVTRASHAIDRLLGRDPLGEGESRPGGSRVLLVPPLGALYEVSPENCMVRVLHVWSFRTPEETSGS